MFVRKTPTVRQTLVRVMRNVIQLAKCYMQCPGCGSNQVTGDKSSWICHSCGSQGQG